MITRGFRTNTIVTRGFAGLAVIIIPKPKPDAKRIIRGGGGGLDYTYHGPDLFIVRGDDNEIVELLLTLFQLGIFDE